VTAAVNVQRASLGLKKQSLRYGAEPLRRAAVILGFVWNFTQHTYSLVIVIVLGEPRARGKIVAVEIGLIRIEDF
jgi:hypothetical protein